MNLVTALCRASQGILKQKLGLMEALSSKHGLAAARELYRTPCPIVRASMGQHIRHSMDHIEPAVQSASNNDIMNRQEIHYDLRTRGGTDEYDWDAAASRVRRVSGLLDEFSTLSSERKSILERPIMACFMLSGDSGDEYRLPSSVARELGFAVHHAIHHMAMVRIIAVNEEMGGLSNEELPSDFGRAPSTVNFDRGSL